MALGDHRGSNQGGQHRAQAVERVQESKNFVWVRHVAHPGVPSCVGEAVAEPSNHEDDHEDGVRRMHGDDDVRNKVAGGGEDADAALTEFEVDGVVEES